MAKKFQTAIDLNKLELQNAVIQNLSAAPGTPAEGQLYYDTDDDNLYVYTTAGWVDCTVQGGGISYGSPTQTINAGDTADAGTGTDVLRSTAQFAVSTGTASSISGSNAEGSGTALARADHNHAFGAGSVPETALAADIRLDTIHAPTASVALNSQKITGLADGQAAGDAVNLGQLQTAQTGLDAKASVRVATTGAITISTGLNSGDAIDGVTLANGDRVLVKDQGTASQNGIYVVAASPARATDMDVWAEVPNAYVWVEEGTQADTGWVCTSNAGGTIDSTDVTWVKFTGLGQITAGNGLTQTGNTINAVGTTDRISVAADAIDISTNYVGQSSITTVGTIATGTWGSGATNIAVNAGGTGANTAANARSNLTAAGYYSSATHGSGTSIAVTAATHGLRASRGLIVQVQNESDGVVEEADVGVAANGDVTVTFATSQSANSKRVTIIG